MAFAHLLFYRDESSMWLVKSPLRSIFGGTHDPRCASLVRASIVLCIGLLMSKSPRPRFLQNLSRSLKAARKAEGRCVARAFAAARSVMERECKRQRRTDLYEVSRHDRLLFRLHPPG